MNINYLVKELAKPDVLPETLQSLRQTELAPHLQKYWTRVWNSGSAGLFVIPGEEYREAKLTLDRITSRMSEYDPLEFAGEEGSSRRIGDVMVILLPLVTWQGFKAADKQKTGTIVHEITHVEDDLANGPMLDERALFSVWQEFLAETVAAPFYDAAVRAPDLNNGMHMVAQKLLGFSAGIAQFGRFLGFLNGLETPTQDIKDVFEAFGNYWRTAAVNSYPVLQRWAEEEHRPQLEVLERVLAPLFG